MAGPSNNFSFNNRSNVSHQAMEMETITSREQCSTERLILKAYKERSKLYPNHCMRLCKDAHIDYLQQRLVDLPESSEALDASQPWLLYWSLHSLRLLKCELVNDYADGAIKLLRAIQSPSGGFGGGPHQLPHLATTYAAVNALCELKSAEALALIDRPKLYCWLMRLRNESDGSFKMHEDGETDVRGAYCAIAIAHLCNILDEKLTQKTADWVAKCQTYEGGFGGVPGLEAHGGCSFCALGTLKILNSLHSINLPKLLRWIASRQMAIEGGFQGRTNKLVDSCYSFWIGGMFALLQPTLQSPTEDANQDGKLQHSSSDWLFDSQALQEYILICCQRYPVGGPVPKQHHYIQSAMGGGANSGGGMIDKPGKNPDTYHTCYALSGLALAQHALQGAGAPTEAEHTNDTNELEEIDVTFNITLPAYSMARDYFLSLT